MGETEKPFACTNDGCQMKFTNEDHLNVHRKKHDMVLNLGIATKNIDVADQTPTPTRFIRNCEEVGLFQDLQNVNPFEETFKKAIENGKCGTLHIPEISTDDTLHTPHIFPHIEGESTVKFIDHEVENQHNEFNINNVPALNSSDILKLDSKIKTNNDSLNVTNIQLLNNSETLNIKEIEKISLKTDSTLTIHLSKKTANKKIKLDLPENDIKTNNIKQKIKAALKNKLENEDVSAVKVQYVNNNANISDLSSNKKKILHNNPYVNSNCIKTKQYSEMSDIEKRRALNRAAQLRSRARKKIWVKEMETEIDTLKCDNKKLLVDNQNLKNENAALKMILLQHKNCSVAQDPATIEQTQKLLNTPKVLPTIVASPPKLTKKKKHVLPVPTTSLPKVIAIEVPTILTTVPTMQATPISVLSNNNNKSHNINLTAVPIYTTNIQKTTNIINSELVKQITFPFT